MQLTSRLRGRGRSLCRGRAPGWMLWTGGAGGGAGRKLSGATHSGSQLPSTCNRLQSFSTTDHSHSERGAPVLVRHQALSCVQECFPCPRHLFLRFCFTRRRYGLGGLGWASLVAPPPASIRRRRRSRRLIRLRIPHVDRGMDRYEVQTTAKWTELPRQTGPLPWKREPPKSQEE